MRRYRYLSLQMVLLLMLVRAFAAEEAMIKGNGFQTGGQVDGIRMTAQTPYNLTIQDGRPIPIVVTLTCQRPFEGMIQIQTYDQDKKKLLTFRKAITHGKGTFLHCLEFVMHADHSAQLSLLDNTTLLTPH